MLIEFRLKNVFCFKDEQVFSLVATKDKSLTENVISKGGGNKLNLLRSAVVYGANASGKTKLIWALYGMAKFVADSATQKADYNPFIAPFIFDQETGTSPSEIEITFVNQGIRYQYGFSFVRGKVIQEYLNAAPRGVTVPYFQRTFDEAAENSQYQFGASFKKNDYLPKATKNNALFLSIGGVFEHPQLKPAFDWFQKLNIFPSPHYNNWATFTDDNHSSLKELLRFSDFGIIDFKLEEKREGEEKPIQERIKTTHKIAGGNSSLDIPLEMESDGTIRTMNLGADILDALEKGKIFIVDELDSSLHPLLVRSIIEMFHNPEINKNNAQLIFNTHDTTLLDQTLFRRDQVWFTEKDAEGAAHLYSLSEYSPRKGEALAKGYLQGRYGAIPFLGEPSLIFTRGEADAQG